MKKIWIIILILVVAAVLLFLAVRHKWVPTLNDLSHPTYATYQTYSSDFFSFNYPKDFNVTNFSDEAGKTILIQNSAGSGAASSGAQIYISNYDEDNLTVEKINNDIPDMIIENPQEFTVGEVKGLAFEGRDDSLGKTYEVWVVYQSKLYQFLSSQSGKDLVDQILKTWKWKQ